MRYLLIISLFFSCSTAHKIQLAAKKELLLDTTLRTGFTGVSVWDATAGKYIYNYQADHYFIPASNVKLFTVFAGLKYLSDSLIAFEYYKKEDTTYIFPTGDPTLLHPNFSQQPLNAFLASCKNVVVDNSNAGIEKYGRGWAWDDYNDAYMAERNALPLYGNMVNAELSRSITTDSNAVTLHAVTPGFVFGKIAYHRDSTLLSPRLRRDQNANNVNVYYNKVSAPVAMQMPISTQGIQSSIDMLRLLYPNTHFTSRRLNKKQYALTPLYSQPRDSLFRQMLWKSDNFFAEQTLLMASGKRLGYMSSENFIDSTLAIDLADIPQKPGWIDGSGLSRYNLFTPQSFIFILKKLYDVAGFSKMKILLPTGDEGTLTNYFKEEKGFIYAKTGTLSNNSSLCGYLVTKKNHVLMFAILCNNFKARTAPARRAMERFVKQLRGLN